MNENPFEAPSTETMAPGQRSIKSLACVVMFWLSSILGIGLIALNSWNAYTNFRFLSENQMGLPTYVVVVPIWFCLCGGGLLYSGYLWRACNVRRALIVFLGSLASIFLGPTLLWELFA